MIRINTHSSYTGFVAAFLWITGLVLAKGFWSTFFALIFPPWGWYLIIFTTLMHYGVIG